MEMKRTILAVVLSMAVLLLYQHFWAPKPPPRVPGEAPGAVPSAPPAAAPATGPAPVAELAAADEPATPAPPATEVTRAVLENDRVRVELASRGAVVEAAELKTYRQTPGPSGPLVRLLGGVRGLDQAGAIRLHETQPRWGVAYRQVEASREQVAYVWEGPGGVRLEKSYRLEPGRFDLELTVRVVNGSDAVLRDRLGLLVVEDFGKVEEKYAFVGPAFYQEGEFQEVKLKDLPDGVQATGKISWAALLRKYFLVAVLPNAAEDEGLRIGAYRGEKNVAELELEAPLFELAPGGAATFGYRIYLGPKLAEALAPLGSDFGELINYGFFHVVAKPLAVFLQMIHGVVGNWGVAIIILTTVIKLIFWPLSSRSFRSMQRMKELQPKMQRLKERYGNDRERLNMEVMQLYKTHKVNPLGGCLPMLVQIPFFFALYKILLNSIELRHAPFVFWIQDLAAKDPYYITPLLMGATMFLQQKMTPSTGAANEGQMKMMMYGMPVIFTFLFLNFPSGLVIYWLVNNVLTIAQQGMMLRGQRAQPA